MALIISCCLKSYQIVSPCSHHWGKKMKETNIWCNSCRQNRSEAAERFWWLFGLRGQRSNLVALLTWLFMDRCSMKARQRLKAALPFLGSKVDQQIRPSPLDKQLRHDRVPSAEKLLKVDCCSVSCQLLMETPSSTLLAVSRGRRQRLELVFFLCSL